MKNILLVDDESSLIMSMADGLESQGDQFRVYTANNGKEAVETLETKPVDLVVTDLRMPEMDGFELLAYINDNRPSTPTIVMSAFATPRIEDKLKELGALQVLSKPLDFERLSEAIRQGLDHVFQGGSLAGISVGSFLQLMEAEQKTSLLEVLSEEKQKGFFYLDEGQLHDAVCGDLQGEEAAIEMLTWKGAQIRFRSLPEKKLKKNIHQGLMSLLMEASHLEDERAGAEAGPPSESLGDPEDLSLDNVGEDGDESVLDEDLSLDGELGTDDVVSGDLGADDVSWLVEDLGPAEDTTVVEKVPGADEKTLFHPDQEEDIAVLHDDNEEEDGGPEPLEFSVDSLDMDEEPALVSAPAFDEETDLFDINDTSLDEDGDLFSSGDEEGLFVVEENPADEVILCDTPDAGNSGELFAVQAEPSEDNGLFAVEEMPPEEPLLPKMETSEDSGELFGIEETPAEDAPFVIGGEPKEDSGLLELGEVSEEGDAPFEIEETYEDDDDLLETAEIADEDIFGASEASDDDNDLLEAGPALEDDDDLFGAGASSDDGDDLFGAGAALDDDDDLFGAGAASDDGDDLLGAGEPSENKEAPLELSMDSDATGDILSQKMPEEIDDLGEDGLFALEEDSQEAMLPLEEDSDGLYELEDDGLEDGDGLYDMDEMPDGDFSGLDDSRDDLSFDGISGSENAEFGDDGLPDLDMELPDEVPPPPPVMAPPAPRTVPPRAEAGKTSAFMPETGTSHAAAPSRMDEDQVARIKGLLKDMADEIEGVRVCAISGMDGIGLAEHNPKGADVQAFGGKFAVVMQLINKSAQDLNIGRFQENLVQTENAWILTRFLSTEYYLVIAVGRESTLGNVRMVVSKYSKELDGIFHT